MLKLVGLAAIVAIASFVSFTGSAYLASKNHDTPRTTLDPAVSGFNDYLNFITGKRSEPIGVSQTTPKERPSSSSIEYPTPKPSSEVIQQPKESEELNKVQNTVNVAEEPKVLPACSPDYKTDCVYKFDIYGAYYQQYLEDKVLELINKDRISHGLKPLKYSGKAANHAYIHSKNMAFTGVYAHSNPELRTWRDYSGLVRYTCGENIWNLYDPFDPNMLRMNNNVGNMDFKTSVAKEPSRKDFVSLDDIANWIHAGFMGSPTGHRQNILNTMWTEGGIGIYIDTANNNRLWVTEDLCK